MDLTVTSSHPNFFVVDNQKKLLGIISIHDLRKIIYEQDALAHIVLAHDLMMPINHFFLAEESLDEVTKAFSEIVVDEMPVVDNSTQKHLVGIICKDDVIDTYNRAILKRDTVNSVFSYLNAIQKFQRVEIADGQILCEIEVPGSFVKNSLQKLNLRNRFGVEVILVKQNYNPRKNEWEIVLTPRPDYHFKFGDTILVMGSTENIDKIKNLT